MSMTYCTCERCGASLLLDVAEIAQRGYLCDACFKQYGAEYTKPVKLVLGCPQCGDITWARKEDGSFRCKGCGNSFKQEEMEAVVI